MLKKLTPYLLSLLATSQAMGQAATCTQTLRLAQSTYESGRLHELYDICATCLDGKEPNGEFNTEERRQAYKLLVQSYIYLEEPEKADEAMLQLLATDHFFRPNRDVDPAEFVSLYNRFRTKSLFRIGGKVGLAINAPLALTDNYVGSDSEGTTTYGPGVTPLGGLVFEKDFLDDRLTIAPEFGFAAGSFKESMDIFTKDSIPAEGTPEATILDDVISMRWLELNPLVKWWLSKDPASLDGKFEPYIIGGPGINYVLAATFEEGKLEHTGGAGTNTGPGVDIKELFKPLNYTAIVGGGVRRRISGVYILFDVRLQYGLSNLIGSKTLPETAFDYSWQPNDFKLNRITFNLQVQLAKFSPKKLIQ